MKKIIYGAIAIGAIGTVAVMAYAGQSLESLFSGFTAWTLAPFAIFALACSVARNRGVVIVTLVAVILALVLGAFIYIDALFVHIHSTGALVFIFVPLYQLIVAVIVLVAALTTNQRKQK
jgi:hypothetical protein